MADTALLMLFDDTRGKTLKVLQGLTDEQARWTPPGLHNSIVWHAAHCYLVVEWLTLAAQGLEPQDPKGWFSHFNWESRPAEIPADAWPTLAEAVALLESQRDRLRAHIAGMTDAQLDAPAKMDASKTARWAMVHGLHDEARHSGEISLMRKLQGLKSQ